jgi:hypothetical protein
MNGIVPYDDPGQHVGQNYDLHKFPTQPIDDLMHLCTEFLSAGNFLALVRYIMLSHGGTAVYAAGPESGSAFRLVL